MREKKQGWSPKTGHWQYGEPTEPVSFSLPESIVDLVQAAADADFEGNTTKEVIRVLAQAYDWSPNNG